MSRPTSSATSSTYSSLSAIQWLRSNHGATDWEGSRIDVNKDLVVSWTEPTIYHVTEIVAGSQTFIQKMIQLNARIEALEKAINRLADRLSNDSPNEEARQVSDDEAAKEVKSFFEARHGEDLYPDDVAENLDLPLDQAIRVCARLAEEKKIARK
jgi:hypothetical protein